jgi:hypothetical protein
MVGLARHARPDVRADRRERDLPARPDKRWASFRLRPEARFSDGSPLTAEDVVFTFEAMSDRRGQIRYRAYFGEIERVEALGEHEVKFTFAEGAAVRDLLPIVAGTADLLEDPITPGATSRAPRSSRRSARGPTRSSGSSAGRTVDLPAR